MKRSNYKAIVMMTMLFVMQSCVKDFLDKTPDEDLTSEQVFTNPGFTREFLANIYSYLPNEAMMVDNTGVINAFNGAADEMEITHEPFFSNLMNAGNWSSNTYTSSGWSPYYQAIRNCNIFLENIHLLKPNEFFPEATINQWVGEVYFLRAFYYFLLVRIYGPVPVFDRTVGLNEDFKLFKRVPIDQCVQFIVADCNRAAEILPPRITQQNELGRPSKVSALALKGRTLLYMASPFWNGNPDYASFTDRDGVRLFPDFSSERWQEAASAAKECIDIAEAAGHRLHRSASNNPIANYQETFYVNFNDEVFFTRNDPSYIHLDTYSEPWGIPGAFFPHQGVTQDQVDAYHMANGEVPILGYNPDKTPIINPASGYSENGNTAKETPFYVAGTRDMYVGREPRFYASINFTGAKYKMVTDGLKFWFGGPNGRQPGQSAFTRTGYLMKKLTHPDYDMATRSGTARTWIFFRLGEQYLNYAEALNEVSGPVADVYKYVNLIRERSGIPGLPAGLTKEQMRARIRHERRIELAFETHRYFDCIRWKIAEQVNEGPIYGLDISTPGYTMDSDDFYRRTLVESRVFEKKHNLWPIPFIETEKNINLVQNPGWD
ncbi:hypothetical protein GCM10011386_01370 [Parapedobacter defluvii]|uniref:RagB/SusD family nutrient uptake outer membrane protein n=2 Tax=Parapedobacter defluvii TaxID=2045106 RepID=A0ABQ1L1V5_9SPHI|nr:hypothetical protein GCM10011386_01370 [Parapedobacter defluvii]